MGIRNGNGYLRTWFVLQKLGKLLGFGLFALRSAQVLRYGERVMMGAAEGKNDCAVIADVKARSRIESTGSCMSGYIL